MNRFGILTTIAAKELREALRDRKTLLLTLLLPMLLYPGLMLLVTQVAATQQAELESVPSRVGVVGEVPASLIEAFRLDADTVLVDVPPTIADPAQAGVDALVRVEPDNDASTEMPAWEVTIRYRSVVEESALAQQRATTVLAEWSEAEVARRIDAAGLPPSTLVPLQLADSDLTPVRQRGGHLLGSVLPLLVLVTILMGSMYPAIDVTAGEKERMTIQTLFTAPVSAVEVVGGKYLAVVTLGMITGAANLVSLALVFGHSLLLSGAPTDELDFTIAPAVFVGLALAVVMIAALVSALLMCAAVLARNFIDAQTYVTPVYLLVMVPALIAQMPGFELSPGTALIPGVGPLLLMRSMLLDGVQLDSLFLVGAGSLAWAMLFVLLATRLFDSEDIITGGRGSLASLAGRSGDGLRNSPTVGESLAWYAVCVLILYYAGSALQSWSPRLGLVATLWLLLAAPTVVVARRLHLSLRSTFALWRPDAAGLGAGVLLGSGVFVLVATLAGLLGDWLPQPPPEVAEQLAREMARFFPPPENVLDYAVLLFVGAVSPAICEEVLFRGFLLSGLRSRMGDAAAIAVSAVLFAIFHLSVYRLFGTALLGVVLGLLVVRTGSLVPAIAFHALNNGLALVLLPLGTDEASVQAAERTLASYAPWALASTVLGAWLLSRSRRAGSTSV